MMFLPPGSTVELADGADGAAADLARGPLDAERPLGRGQERVAPQVHRRGAGVVGVAEEGDACAAPSPAIAVTAPIGSCRRLEHAALLDVQLDEGVDRARLRLAPAIGRALVAVGRQRVAIDDAVGIDEREHVCAPTRGPTPPPIRWCRAESASPPRRRRR